MPHGYLGVDIFFVISGFFISKRLARILPALVFMVLICITFAALFLEKPAESFSTGFYSTVGLSNLYLYLSSAYYFQTSAFENIFIHTWSLGVEEQFYFAFPVAFLFFYCFVKDNFKSRLTIFLTASAVVSLAIYLYFKFNNRNIRY